MSSAVVEKNFVWRFIDKITQGVKEARNAMQEAEEAAKQTSNEVSETSNKWTNYGNKAKESAEKASNSYKEYKDQVTSSTTVIKEQLSSLNEKVKAVPKEHWTKIKAKIEDSNLGKFARKVHDIPKSHETTLSIKDRLSNQLKKAQNQVNDTKKSFSDLKMTMAGTFLGGAALGGIYAIGNGLKEAAAAGMEFNTEQQKMNQTWLTLTGNADKGKAMVDTINELSVKTGQSRDLVNELEQGFYHLHSRKSEADDMTKAMLNMGDAVGLTSDQMKQVEQDMVHGLATGKVTQGELNQIGMYFPMIDEAMAKHFNTSVAGMRQMASAGKITGKDLEEVFEKLGSGKYSKAADNMMQSMWGMERTIKSQTPALIGAFEKPFFEMKSPFYASVSKWMLDPATQKGFQNAGKVMAQAFSGAFTVISSLVSPFVKLYQAVSPVLKLFASGVWAGMKESFTVMVGAVKLVSDAFSAAITWISKFFAYVGKITGLSSQFSKFGGGVKALGGIFGAVLGPVIALKGAIAAYNTVLLAHQVVLNVVTKASKLFAGAQGLVNLSLSANPIGLFIVALTAVIAILVLAYKKVKPFRDAVNRLGNSIKRLFTGKSSWGKAFVKQLSDIGKAFAKDGKAIISTSKKIGRSIKNAFTGKAGWEKSIGKFFKDAGKSYQQYSKKMDKQQEQAHKRLVKQWNGFWDSLAKGARKGWSNMGKHVANGVKNVKKAASAKTKSIEKNWDQTWTNISNFTRQAWKFIKQHSSDGITNIHNVISSGISVINKLWSAGWDLFSNIFKGIWDGIKQAAQDGINAVIDIINAGIGGIDKVWSFFTGHGTGIKKLGKVHFAQGGTVHRHLSVINDGDGPDWKELVQMPDGGLFMSQERNWTGFLPEGSRVYSGAETKAIMGMAGVEHYATGGIVGAKHFADGGIVDDAIDWAKGTLDNIGSWIGDKIDALMKFLDHPVEEVKKVVEKAVGGMYNNAANFGDLAKGNWDKLTDKMGDWITKQLEPVLDKLLEANPGGAGVARWRPYILRAAKQLGVQLSSGQIQKMLTQINTESKGNPNAIGGTDGLSDGRATGLLQFKPGTFRHWAISGHGNIMSGYDQILAAINCLNNGGEGGWGSFGIPGRGWATGGEITSQMLGWVGDNPQHHEFVLNPYATSAEPLLDKAFEATAQAQPATQGVNNSGNSKLDQMIDLLGKVLVAIESQDTDVYLDSEKVSKKLGRIQAKRYSLTKG
ncbi:MULTISPECIES: tape measure protein [Limosilactobacillus]|uniref:tape measure protein n=1 Tax=Limosilactobacillus TaxID=2742598 RepID=UPI002430C6D4|nr:MULTISPECIES: tape measure protein [Limosilactobacillus]MCI6852592.1 tape measure protein [Limosilactobacillus vaginalis]MDY4865065.1 tape measure protein [Limosilactobacillus sp.]